MTPTQPRTKRTRRVNSPAASNALVGTQTATAAVALTGLKDPSHFISEDVDPSLIVDYNESTPLPSPHSSDADNELMRSDDAALLPIQTSLMAHNMETASFTNAVPSSVSSNTATNDYGTARKGASASSSQIIHNGSDYEEPELKARQSTRNVRSLFHIPIVFHVAM